MDLSNQLKSIQAFTALLQNLRVHVLGQIQSSSEISTTQLDDTIIDLSNKLYENTSSSAPFDVVKMKLQEMQSSLSALYDLILDTTNLETVHTFTHPWVIRSRDLKTEYTENLDLRQKAQLQAEDLDVLRRQLKQKVLVACFRLLLELTL